MTRIAEAGLTRFQQSPSCSGLIAAAFVFTAISRTLLFWSAFTLTRPLGATVGDLLDKPRTDGGLELSRLYASALLAVLMMACIVVFRQCDANPGERQRG